MTGQHRLFDAERSKQPADLTDAERQNYCERLREKLQDPVFRAIDGFPIGTDDAILSLSGPPYYTACPNPFLEEFIERYGRPYDPNEPYHREPFAVDVSEGKTHPLYRAHSYHTKVPHLAIAPSILHYTQPGDIVLDGFCGSGMTGVAAQWCGNPPEEEKRVIEARFKAEGRPAPKWGARRAILNDLSPYATFIASNYNVPFNIDEFARTGRQLLAEVDAEIGWMYETRHHDGRIGRIEYTVWSEVFVCPGCLGETLFADATSESEISDGSRKIHCSHCGATSTKEQMTLAMAYEQDDTLHEVSPIPRRVPVRLVYEVAGTRFEKEPDKNDLALLERLQALAAPPSIPREELPDSQMTRVGRMRTTNTATVKRMFLPRQAHAVGLLWEKAKAHPVPRTRLMLMAFVEQGIWTLSVLNRYRPSGYSQVNQYMTGVFYVPSQISECSPWYVLSGKLSRLAQAFNGTKYEQGAAMISTGDCAELRTPASSIDYVFTDPPFGENIYYSDLNFLIEAFYSVFTNARGEAIIDRAKKKGLYEYQDLMRGCFTEYYRVLKPGRWMTVVFHNSKNAVWNAIQEAILSAGFVIADVRTLDKQQGSFRQVTSTAVKQDLVISAYKPTGQLELLFRQRAGTTEGAWDFVREHLDRLPITVEKNGTLEAISERRDYLLFDRMVAFHVQRGANVPLSAAEFHAGLRQRFPERDGMYFLPEQVPQYDAARLKADSIGQLDLFVSDEKSSLHWLRQQLDPALGGKPQTYQEIQPLFLKQLHQVKHELLPELLTMLEENFLGDVQDHWRAPDPAKLGDLEAIRLKSLLREFNAYTETRGKLKQFRTEAVRAGFAHAYKQGDYLVIVKLAERLPESVLQEDPDLLMYYDNASLRT